MFFPLNIVIFLNSASSAAALVFYLPGVCTHTDTEGKQRKARVWNILKPSERTQNLINTLYVIALFGYFLDSYLNIFFRKLKKTHYFVIKMSSGTPLKRLPLQYPFRLLCLYINPLRNWISAWQPTALETGFSPFLPLRQDSLSTGRGGKTEAEASAIFVNPF